MGGENFQKFFQFLSEDKEALEKVKSLGGDFDALAAYAKELGYDVSPEELREYRQKAHQLVKVRVRNFEQKSTSPGAQAFYALLKLAETDKEVEKRLEELGEGTSQELIAYAKEKGFIFSEQDLDDVGKDILDPSDELSDEELEIVAGGTTATVFGILVFGLALFAVVALFVAAFVLGDSNK